jgi:prepilin-type N-terminal cleavage/methylation domain-containing protein
MKINKQGFTLVESLIGVVLLGILMTSAMTIMSDLSLWQKRVELSFDYSSLRNQIVNQLIDYRAWSNTVKAPINTIYTCFLNQDHMAAADRDCTGQTGTVNIFDLANTQVFDFKNASFGFTLKGEPCTTFSATAGAGNFNCPLRLNLTSEPMCDATLPTCENPLVKLTGQFVFNGAKEYANLRLSNLDFTLYKSNLYCPDQATPIGLLALNDVNIAGSQVTSTQSGKVTSIGIAETDQKILPCRNVNITFNDFMPAAVLMPLTLSDPENRSIVCLYNSLSNQCVYEFTRFNVAGNYTYSLSYKGVVVANKPSWLTITSTSIFEFRISNGLVKFCVDDQCSHLFEGKLDFPFVLRVTPAGVDYSANGITVLSITSQD